MAILKSKSTQDSEKALWKAHWQRLQGRDHTLGISGKRCTRPQTPVLGKEARRCYKEGAYSKMARTRWLWDVLLPALSVQSGQFPELFWLFLALGLFLIHPPDLESPSCTHIRLSLFKLHPLWRPFPIPPPSPVITRPCLLVASHGTLVG